MCAKFWFRRFRSLFLYAEAKICLSLCLVLQPTRALQQLYSFHKKVAFHDYIKYTFG